MQTVPLSSKIKAQTRAFDAPHQLLLLILVWGCSALFFTFAGSMLLQFFYPQWITASNLWALRSFQLIQSIGMFGVPAALVGWLLKKNHLGHFNVRTAHPYSWPAAALLILCSAPLIQWSAFVNTHLPFPDSLKWLSQQMAHQELKANELMQKFIVYDTPWNLFFTIALMTVVPAIGEEWFFRGTLQPVLGRMFKNVHWGIVFTAILFSALHGQFLTFLPRFFLGLMLGYLFYYGQSMWLPVLSHFFNNALALAAYILHPEARHISYDSPPVWLTAGSLIGVLGLIYLLRKVALNPEWHHR